MIPSPQTPSSEAAEARLLELHAQLAQARAAFRDERRRHESAYRDDLTALAEARAEAEARESQAAADRRSLKRLRRMFLERWRTQWATERAKVQAQRDRLTSDQIALEAGRRTFGEVRDDFEIHVANEKAKIQKGWEDLSAEEQDWRLRSGIDETQAQRRREELDEYARQLVGRENAWLAQEELLKATCTERAAELAGLERRIAAIRLQLPMPVCIYRAPTLETGASDDERGLVDARTRDLLQARADWRDELADWLRDFEESGERLQQREAELDHREGQLRAGEADLERERRETHKLRKQLEAMQARLRNREAERKTDRELLEAEVRHLHSHRKAFRQGLDLVVERWGVRQATEQDERRGERSRSLAMLEVWTENLKSLEQNRADVETQALSLAGKAIVLERTRAELLERVADPALARKRIERYERRLQRSSARAEADLEMRRGQLQAAIGELREYETRVQDGLDALARERAEAVGAVIEREKALELDREAFALQAAEIPLKDGQLRQREATIRLLQEEVERLSRLLYDGEAIPLLRAA